MLGRGCPLGSLVCDVLICFVTFPGGVLGPGSGVVLDCIDFLYLPPYLLGINKSRK